MYIVMYKFHRYDRSKNLLGYCQSWSNKMYGANTLVTVLNNKGNPYLTLTAHGKIKYILYNISF